MGYRSEVALAISKDLMPHFLAVLAKEPQARPLIFKDHDHLDQDYKGEGTLLVVWSEIKWYTDYPEVKAIQDFIESCELDDAEYMGFKNVEYPSEHVRFVRLGEDNDDIEEKGTLHNWDIATYRSLNY